MRNQLQAEVQAAESQLESLKDDIDRARANVQRVEKQEAVLREEIKIANESLATAVERRRARLESSSGNVDPQLQVVLVSEIQQLRGNVSDLRKELVIRLPDQKDEYLRQQNQLSRELQESKAELRAARLQLDNLLVQTRASEVQHSIESASVSDVAIIGAGLLLGRDFGGCAALEAEFIAAINRRHHRTYAESHT